MTDHIHISSFSNLKVVLLFIVLATRARPEHISPYIHINGLNLKARSNLSLKQRPPVKIPQWNIQKGTNPRRYPACMYMMMTMMMMMVLIIMIMTIKDGDDDDDNEDDDDDDDDPG